tara:strand:+ start:2149 stop:2322 length:174 start_codon:yes stop_codon:yes gene_type:complete
MAGSPEASSATIRGAAAAARTGVFRGLWTGGAAVSGDPWLRYACAMFVCALGCERKA